MNTSASKVHSKPLIKKLERHVFVCTNERPDGHARGCCKTKGADAILKALKEKAAAEGLQSTIRVQKSGCLDVCESGAALVVYPEGVWYGGLSTDDPQRLEEQLETIVQSHLKCGRPVEALQIPGK